jgi:hypothetical protein
VPADEPDCQTLREVIQLTIGIPCDFGEPDWIKIRFHPASQLSSWSAEIAMSFSRSQLPRVPKHAQIPFARAPNAT